MRGSRTQRHAWFQPPVFRVDNHFHRLSFAARIDAQSSQDQLPPSPVFAPMQWKRAHLLWASLVMQGILVGIWEFSYSSTFATYVYQFIVGFKIAQVGCFTVSAGYCRRLLLDDEMRCQENLCNWTYFPHGKFGRNDARCNVEER